MRSPRLKRLFARAAVRVVSGRAPGGAPLPPRFLRAASGQFHSDEGFLEAARSDAERLVELAGLRPGSSILDIGCGAGRLAIGFSEVLPGVRYVGIDVMPAPLRWCQRHLSAHDPRFEFHLLDVANERYNPGGTAVDEGFALPLAEEFDAVYAYSVFSHMRTPDVAAYLRETARLLAPDGRAFVTAFVEHDVPDEEVNPAGYGPFAWKGALHGVRYDITYFERLVEDAGLHLAALDHGTETDGQSFLQLTT